MDTFRHQVALRMIGRRFVFLLTKDVLQLLQNFMFELRALIGMECLGRSEDTKFLFDKSFRNGLFFLVRKCDEHSKSSKMINDSCVYEHFSPVGDTDSVLSSTRFIETLRNGRSTGR